MSILFSVFRLAPYMFNQPAHTTSTSSYTTSDVLQFRLPSLLQDVVSSVSWLPTETSTGKAFQYVRYPPE